MKRRTSRLLSILLALCLALALLPGTALAKGKDDIAYPVTGGNIYFDPAMGTVTDADYTITAAIIPSTINGVPVTTIGENAFSYCDNLTNITILGNMNSIGKRAFRDCDRLSSIILPDGVTTIGYEAFCSCDRLVSVTIPVTVFTIGEGAFQNCYSLTDVYYGGSDSQWEQINIGALNNGLLTATIHYNGTAPAPSASGSVSVTVNGKAVVWTDAAPFIDANNRTMVPLRAVADAMGLDVNWDAAARVASFTGSGKTIDFPIDSTNARTSSGGTVRWTPLRSL